jgi:hypothetical protein
MIKRDTLHKTTHITQNTHIADGVEIKDRNVEVKVKLSL